MKQKKSGGASRPPRPPSSIRKESADDILKRLETLHPKLIDLSLGRVQRLLADLGDPQTKLPPAIHVAGTNGKGSTCAFLRAMGEAAGWRVHMFTSPHLVGLQEMFYVASRIATDNELAAALHEIEATNAGAPITGFEALVAAAYLQFSRAAAELCVVEVGMGGQYDATNVMHLPAAIAITSISRDHCEFLGRSLTGIARHKAGIIRRGRPVVTGLQSRGVLAVLRHGAEAEGAPFLPRGEAWDIALRGDALLFSDNNGDVELPQPSLMGAHQVENAGIAVAALRAGGLALPHASYRGLANAQWPARLQRLHGKLAALLPPSFELWLDGGHNPGAGRVLAAHLKTWADRPTYVVVGMKQGKDAGTFLKPLLDQAQGIWAAAETGQMQAMPASAIVEASAHSARLGPDVVGALGQIGRLRPGRVLICGSLHLAGEVLKADGSVP